jgi:hypothetical protein
VAITRRTAAASSGNNTTSCTVVIPAAVLTGDVLVLDVVNRDATTNVSVADNEGAGSWARITTVNATTNGSGQLWWKRATGNTASKTITVSGATGSVACVVTPYVGASIGSAPLGTPVGEANASGNELQAGITTARDGSWVHHAVACTSNDTLNPGDRTATSPTTLTESGEGVSAGGSDCSVSAASAEKTTAGATGNISWAQTDGTGASYAVEVLIATGPLTAASGSLAMTGTDAVLKYNRKVVADSGSFAMTGTAATLTRSYPLTASSGSFTVTGTDATLKYARILTAGSGSFALTGTAATTKYNRLVAAASGAFAVTGTDATLTHGQDANKTLTAESGSFTLTGTAATLKYNRVAVASSGSFALTGTAAALKYGRVVVASAGSFAMTGADATLTLGLPEATNYELAASSGVFTLTGTDAALKYNRIVVAESGAFTFAGTAATLTKFHPPSTPRKHARTFSSFTRSRSFGGLRRIRRQR